MVVSDGAGAPVTDCPQSEPIEEDPVLNVDTGQEFATIGAAVQAASAGHRIHVRGGE